MDSLIDWLIDWFIHGLIHSWIDSFIEIKKKSTYKFVHSLRQWPAGSGSKLLEALANPRWVHRNEGAQIPSSWWFQPIWKIFLKLDHFPRDRGENKNIWNHHLAIYCRFHILLFEGFSEIQGLLMLILNCNLENVIKICIRKCLYFDTGCSGS